MSEKKASDDEMIAWFRRRPTQVFQERDIEGSADMYSIMPVEFFLAWTIKAKVIVEIGTHDGSSAIPLLKAAEETGGCLHSVDPDGCESGKELVAQYGLNKHWEFHNITSDEFFKSFNETIDFAFIDGDHAWPQVAKDLENCMQHLRGTGIIMVHDYLEYPEYSDRNPPPREAYENECSCGIPKALSVVLPRYPEFGAIKINDTAYPYVIITFRIGIATWNVERPSLGNQLRLPPSVYEVPT